MSFRRLLDRLYDAAGYLAAFFVFAIFAVMIGQTAMREVGLPTGGTDDLVAWFTAASAFLAMAHTFKHGDFVRVTLVLQQLTHKRRRVLEIISLAISSLFVGYLAYWSASFVHESWSLGEMAGGLIVIPIWIPQVSFVLGATLLFIALLDELIIVARGNLPTYRAAAEARHRAGDFSEDL